MINMKTAVSGPTIHQAATDFVSALQESKPFAAFEQASERLRQDNEAQQIINDYQTKQQSLQMMMMLGSLSADDRAELQRLEQALQDNNTIVVYMESQLALQQLCQTVGHTLSRQIGFDFAAACGSSCCG
jgi:cell fate (sporulation/competence/biofilm development) regulator YlbF (YheA/YmcA/DUF963 family)